MDIGNGQIRYLIKSLQAPSKRSSCRLSPPSQNAIVIRDPVFDQARLRLLHFSCTATAHVLARTFVPGVARVRYVGTYEYEVNLESRLSTHIALLTAGSSDLLQARQIVSGKLGSYITHQRFRRRPIATKAPLRLTLAPRFPLSPQHNGSYEADRT